MNKERNKYREQYRLLGPQRLFAHDNLVPTGESVVWPSIFKSMRDQDRFEFFNTRQTILNIFGVKNFSDIPPLEDDPNFNHQECLARLYSEWARVYGVEGTEEEFEAAVQDALEDADALITKIDDPQNGIFRSIREDISCTNEIALENDPLKLLQIMFSEDWSRRARFEARRKLILADLSLAVREHSTHRGEGIKEFNDFLNEFIFEGPVGDLVAVDIISTHSPIDYGCFDVQALEPDEKTHTNEFRLFHRLQMRTFGSEPREYGRPHYVMVDQRAKRMTDYIIKLMRKDERSAGVVDDPLGFKLTFFSKKDINRFMKKLQVKARKAGSMIRVEGHYDTIDNNDEFRITNPGSSPNLEIMKVHIHFNGHLIELQMHTVRTHLDSRIRDGVGHEEFSLKRLVDSGKWDESIMDLLYPEDIFGPSWKQAVPELIADIRESNRIRSSLLPPERTVGEKQELRYSAHDLAADTAILLRRIAETSNVSIPEYLVAVNRGAIPVAHELSLAMGGVQIVVLNSFDSEEDIVEKCEPLRGHKVLLVDDIGERCRAIARVKNVLPEAKVAVLIKKTRTESDAYVDYYARELPFNVRAIMYWERGRNTDEYRAPMHVAVLPYRIHPKLGVQFLVQELHKTIVSTLDGRSIRDGTANCRLKLLGGAKEVSDTSLRSAAGRELSEEIEGLNAEQLMQLSDVGYEYDRPGSIYKTGFVTGYALPVPYDETEYETKDPGEVKQLVWVTPPELINQLYPPQYAEAVAQWIPELLQSLDQ